MFGDLGATTPHPKMPMRLWVVMGRCIVLNPVREIA
jgi:hypothetical protein